jgi:hypothetical protein
MPISGDAAGRVFPRRGDEPLSRSGDYRLCRRDRDGRRKAGLLTRRTAMDLAGASRGPDPALVRHICDLHMMRTPRPGRRGRPCARHCHGRRLEFVNQFPAYATDIAGETAKALDALRTDPLHRRRYDDFVSAMVYGERPSFDEAFATVAHLAEDAWRAGRS